MSSRRLVYSCLVGALVSGAIGAGCDGPPSHPTTLSGFALSPIAGPMSGSTPVTISGIGFQMGATVHFGDKRAVVKELSPTQIIAAAPAHPEGTVNVVVTNPGGQHSTLFERYTFELDLAFTISGVVTELTPAGETLVEGVQVAESGTQTSVLTDERGTYRLAGLRRSQFVLSMSKPGYETLTAPVSASADRQLDVRVERIRTFFVLAGVVYESTATGRVPLEGVVLYCDGCGSPDGHTFVTTDADGLYSFSWTRNGRNWIQFISKDGYRYAGPLDRLGILVNVSGDTRFDIELVKR